MTDVVGVSSNQTRGYTMRLSRLTVDKLGVKLYDRASAVVAELIANAYDADAENVTVSTPLATQLATKHEDGKVIDAGYTISVVDDGHGMDPSEAQRYFLSVGADRRTRASNGSRSRMKKRAVMGRKGIGKLAPFGICKQIEVRSAGGVQTPRGFQVSHFTLNFDDIVKDEEGAVPIASGKDDRTWSESSGTTITLRGFLPKRVPNRDIFSRQLARRFSLAADDFTIHVVNSSAVAGAAAADNAFDIPKFAVDVNEATRIDVSSRPVMHGDRALAVSGWLGFGKQAIRDEEEAGVRIYARGKIVATTRDFEQPAGFTGEFTMRSYLVGEIHAEWLDEDTADDLVRTDRQGILWDSEYGDAFRRWGAELVKEIARKSAGPRRESKSATFLRRANLEARAQERFGDNRPVLTAVHEFGKMIGGFAQEDELDDPDYVNDLADVVLLVGPHQALIRSFQAIAKLETKSIDELVPLFAHSRTAELASYAQIAQGRVDVIRELREVIDDAGAVESDLQSLVARAPWLIRPDWSVISENQGLKTFRDRFQAFWCRKYGVTVEVAIAYERKRPDFTLVHLGNGLHVVELKKPGHAFADDDYDRLQNYLEAFDEFFENHESFRSSFPDKYVINLVADSVDIKNTTRKRAFEAALREKLVTRLSWFDFLNNASDAHAQFLEVHESFE